VLCPKLSFAKTGSGHTGEVCQAKKAFLQAIPVELEPPPVLEAVPVVNVQDAGAFDALKTRTKKNDNGNGIIDYVTTVLKPLMALPLLYTLIVLLCSLEFDRADIYRRKLYTSKSLDEMNNARRVVRVHIYDDFINQ